MNASLPAPSSLLAELTHRCPLSCPYCSNPLELAGRRAELDTATWRRVFDEAAALGVLQVALSGGEPLARADLPEIVAACRAVGLYVNLITSSVGLSETRLTALVEAGLDHVQISVQGVETERADAVAGMAGAHAAKQAAAARVIAAGLPLTVNAVVHRDNIDQVERLVAMAAAWGAQRIEIAHVQYHGWAERNRPALLPSREQVTESVAALERAQARHGSRLAIDAVMPDLHARYPKRCLGGWGSRTVVVTPAGRVLPCHAAETIPHLEFWTVHERSVSDIWHHSPAFGAFRGTHWMREPCRSCARREVDLGGCRCQAFALTGDARATDPVCELSPAHAMLRDAVDGDLRAPAGWTPRAQAP